ncbi:MAG: hypothetical protein JSS61_05690 [Verrucomicrobia bacterium]|nr:hypothetical protein [Verrucomicrobiota bacterium]
MKLLWSLALLLFPFVARADLTSPPPELPVRIETDFYLLNFLDINEKVETFTADTYFSFKWKDPRLAYTPEPGETVRIFVNAAALDKLKKIWRPQIEFVNASSLTYKKRSLFLFPDGTVEYYMSVLGKFSAHLDLRHFPFDEQFLDITVDSFLWNSDIVQFVPAKILPGIDSAIHEIHGELDIIGIQQKTGTTTGPSYLSQWGDSEDYSTFSVTIHVKRRPFYYIFDIFLPLVLIFGISCTVFFAYREPFLDRIMLSLSCLLVLLATKFTVNQDLPQIGYVTRIDQTFLLAYFCIAISVLMSVIEKNITAQRIEEGKKLDLLSRWVVPSIFLVGFLYILFFS